MRVRDVMQASPIQILPRMPFLELQRIFVTAHIGGAPVVDERGVLLGVVTWMDLLRAVDQVCDEDIDSSGPDEPSERVSAHDFSERLGNLTAADVMSPDVVSVSPEMTARDAAEEMRSHSVDHLFVLEGGTMLGSVTALDLLAWTPVATAHNASTRVRVGNGERRIPQGAPTWTGPPGPPFGRVVVGLDSSTNATTALETAAQLPLQIGATLELVTAIEGESSPAIASHREGDANQLLDEARLATERRLPVAGMHQVVVSYGWGVPFAVIADRARHAQAELVVVGRHGKRRLRDLLLGTTAERIVHDGSVSVLVVSARPAAPYRRPLVAIDMSDGSRKALEMTARLCATGVTIIDVLHVISLPARMHGSRDSHEQRARAELSTFLATVNAGASWYVIVQFGDPCALILDEAR